MKQKVRYKALYQLIARSMLVLILSFVFLSSFAQGRTITGVITDDGGVPLPGVNVVVKGTTTGTITDLNGKFSINVLGNETTLSFTYVGYVGQEIQVGTQTTINVTLKEELQQLNEVVVIGYGVQKKKLNTGATLNVGGETIQNLKTNSPMDALKGITPGMSIIQNNGMPGAGTRVTIRGIGTNGDAKPLYVVDGVVVGDIDYLSPSDIESVDVLKDAASSAIYGSRAANGVVLVKTKTGSLDQKTVVTYDAYYGVSNVYKKVDLLDAKQYMMIMDESQTNGGRKPYNWAQDIPDYDRIMSGQWNGTNWFDEMLNKNAPVVSHAINITGGSKLNTYSLGGSYYSQEGILGKQSNNMFERLNLRLNTTFIIWEKNGNNILSVGENLTYTNTKKPTFRQGNIYWNDLHNALVTNPLMPVYDSTGAYHKTLDNWNPNDANPIALMDYNDRYNYNNNNNIVGAGFADFRPLKGLTIHSSYGVSSWFGSTRQWIPAYNLGPKFITTRDQVNQGMYDGSTWTWTNTATYIKSIGKHNFTALVGNEMTKNSQALFINGHNENSIFQNADQAYLSNVPVVDPTYTTLSGKDTAGWAMMSYFGRLSYDYNETYMFTFVLRADGSSTFPQGHRWGTFPSVSGGWLISNEPFMEWSKGFINSLKLRASWGENGNQDIPKFQYLSTLTENNSTDYFFGNDRTVRTVGSFPSRVPNPNLKWETSEQTDLGMDLYILKNRLQFNFDYYDKETKDWLVLPPTLTSFGTSGAYLNGGTVSNKGIELALRWNDQIEKFKYGVTVSVSYNKNRVTQLNTTDSILHGQSNVLSQGTGEMYRCKVGYPMGYFWGYKTNGICQDSTEAANYDNSISKSSYNAKPGDLRYVDINHDSTLNDKDKVMIGDPNPHYILGIQLNADFKGFYLSATANGAFGMQVAESYRSFVDNAQANYTTEILGRWTGPGTSYTIPRVTPVASTYISDYYIHDADYLRISNVTFGYDFKYIFKSLPLAEAKLYFSVNNLHTFTKYNGMDPEVGYSPSPDTWASGIDLGLYPSSQSYMVGLSVKF